jgi:5-oxoprolinase (ATP-hydrolysing) subunit A
MRVDLNCDLGEGGVDDALIMPFITSANIACGAHAGDPGTMRRTVALAVEHGVALGAHPGFADREHFGRRERPLTPDDAYELVVYQIGALAGFAFAAGEKLQHVKPHGALYNMAVREAALADAIARAVRDVDSTLILYGLAGSALLRAGERLGLTVASEAFVDRGYMSDGTLAPRGVRGALLTDVEHAARRALRMVEEGRVESLDNGELRLRVETLCIHGDGAAAAEMARVVRQALVSAGVAVLAPGLSNE